MFLMENCCCWMENAFASVVHQTETRSKVRLSEDARFHRSKITLMTQGHRGLEIFIHLIEALEEE